MVTGSWMSQCSTYLANVKLSKLIMHLDNYTRYQQNVLFNLLLNIFLELLPVEFPYFLVNFQLLYKNPCFVKKN